jgi:hypothetical protein
VQAPATFVELLLDDETLLKLTPNHLLPAGPCALMHKAMAEVRTPCAMYLGIRVIVCNSAPYK